MRKSTPRLTLRVIETSDYSELAALMDLVFHDVGGSWPRMTIMDLVHQFPDGQICIEDDGRIVGAALTIKVDYNRMSLPHVYTDIINENNVIQHKTSGDALYGLDVFVHPDYRGLRLGRRLYEARKELCRSNNLKAILAGGRIPGYAKHAKEMKVAEYIEKIKRRELHDPILSFQLANDFDVKRIMRHYLPEDDSSQGYATLLEWDNFFYEEDIFSVHDIEKTIVRLGIVQWQMRAMESVEDLMQQSEFFVSSLSNYKADFALFPEFFNAPLMGLQNDKNSVEAIRFLASFSDEIKLHFSQLAVTYNINIIAGSMPVIKDDQLYNVSYLLHRDGSIDEQYKIHITPHEKRDWVIDGGDKVKVFETDAGRVGILICYDSEFPELGRMMAEQDVQIIFVPFWTDTKNGYQRVRLCSQARAIENECYVAIGGSVGNLPRVDNVDIQYAQSAVFSPSDIYFPHDATITEASPNTEMIIFADVDLDKLKQLNMEGSVTNLRHRRLDLYGGFTQKRSAK
ncbi:bifunctional GNAT family N-acetyltransferase/carbon-nitrogen hydrolase family protein [Vibrio aestuarianus]|uniref:Bifunctional GNAT family N-acetyltransferase/carbon-nitrogen hydrolase family protein n=1 Tax=Vibrio aestuarianus TaxID=28171 RepID=A0A7X6S4Q6_9VIBR|nr:bifunctional GNAT family N-acetyltransferase/carbon-nitrogen hydrolase family protein [Vibrio aestuarianus]KOE82800.1 hydrolase [Vibrio alginolyticus]MDE1213310.1 bifunctional GNAT family N-acetyltransferase/carbon-nitrogen hydrolase family protein [Vibrio aestuarianus]MDE1217334.1 bifunctional GNAT family N-acetyltransferase/carbon-nitrogen hydrolase family protein [Vibrio aestuarianus]MDE1219746.1 bifunctional GNAT family N-acetyltransferase/carbon-nitrogen hydrolase family protein [Vibrio